MMKKTISLLCLVLCAVLLGAGPAAAETEDAENPITMGTLLEDLLDAYTNPSEEATARIDADVEALNDEVATSIANHWKKVYLDPDYKLYCWKKDDPSEIPVRGKHAFVILGYALEDGKMKPELKRRCDAAAAAAKAFPDSIIVCSGGPTGSNNPDRNTEAGLMKKYLKKNHGIAAERIFTDEKAMTTADNALNTIKILQKQGIETMTIVTSSYHQRWGQVLYNLVAAIYAKEHQYAPEIVGNYCYETDPELKRFKKDAQIAISQAAGILGVKINTKK